MPDRRTTDPERLLRESRERLLLATDAAGIGIFDYDIVNNSITWDARIRALWGVGPDLPITYELFLEGLLPQDRSFVEAAVRRSLDPKGTGEYRTEYRVVARDSGTLRWIAATGRVTFKDRRALRMVGTTRDITEQKITEQSLRESEARFRRAAEAIHGVIYEHDLNTGYVTRSVGLRDVVGYAPHEVPPTAAWWFDRVHPDDRPRVEPYPSIADRARTFSCEYRVRHRDGDYRIVWDQAVIQRDRTGRPTAIIGCALDVTAQRDAEARARRSEERLHAAQEAGGVGTFEWNIERNEAHWSPELEALHGLAPGTFGGTFEAWLELIHPADRDGAKVAIQKALANSEMAGEWRIVLPDGTTRWIDARGWVERDAAGMPACVLGVNLDVTERKRYEKQIRIAMAELSHRVKNTLAVIQSVATQTIARSKDLRDFEERFVQRLRAISDAHRLLTATEWNGVELHDIIHAELAPRVSHDAQYSVNGDPVALEPQRALALHMVVHELATNAAKHGALSTHGGRIEVCWSRSDDEQWLVLHWREHTEHPVSAPATTGYGTQLITELLEYEMGGCVRRSFETSGLGVVIHIPLGEAPGAGDMPCHAARASRAVGPAILVAEDRYALAQTLAEELLASGYSVIGPASTLEQASHLAEQSSPAAALLDVDLRGEHVHPLARRLRGAGVPVVLLTGHDRHMLPADLRDLPLLTKPIQPRTIACVLEELGIRGHEPPIHVIRAAPLPPISASR